MPNNAVINYARSAANLSKISTQVFMQAQQAYGVQLDANFKSTLLGVVDNTLRQFGHKTVNISDGEHLANLNRIIVEDCLRYVGQYASMGAGAGGNNPFADIGDSSAESTQLSKMAENLAAARGYRIQPEAGHTPRIDFAEPIQDHKMSANEMAQKLEAERSINGGGPGGNTVSGNTVSGNAASGVSLNEMLGTEKPTEEYNNPQSEYQKRLQQIRGRDNENNEHNGNENGTDAQNPHLMSDVQGFPVDLPRGSNGPSIDFRKPRMSSTRNSFRLSLDFRKSLESTADGVYILRFPPVQNLVGITLDTCSTMGYNDLTADPNISVHVGNLPSRYGSGTDLFSKLFMEKEINGFFHYRSEETDPLILDNPLPELSHLEISFRTWDDDKIDLNALSIQQITKITKSNCMKIACYDPHFLSLGDALSFQVGKSFSQRLKMLKIVDDHTVITNLPTKFQDLQDLTKIGKTITIARVAPRITLNFKVFQS